MTVSRGLRLNNAVALADYAPRFWRNVAVGAPSDCWNWRLSRSPRGYGQFGVTVRGKGLNLRASRVAFELGNGPIPAGMCVCHKCDNPACCNPAHLFLGTHDDNAKDREAKGRGRQQYGEAQGQARLTERLVTEIRSSHAIGLQSCNSMAVQLGVSPETIRKVCLYKTWRHVA